MSSSATTALVATAITAALGTGIYFVAQGKATVEDLKITVESVNFNPFKDIKGGDAIVTVVLGFGNAHKGSINLDLIDLSFFLGSSRVGGARDYNLKFTINPLALTTKEVKAHFPIWQLGKALGLQVVTALATGAHDANQESLIKRIMPDEIKVTGPIRASGITIMMDKTIPLNVSTTK